MTLLQCVLINVNLLVFFGLFFLFSRGKRNFHFNRFFLLLAPIVAIALPFVSFNDVHSSVTWVSELPTVTILNSRSFIDSKTLNVETLVYEIGAVLFMAILIFQIYKTIKPKKATYLKKFEGTPVYLLHSQESTHSFFNKIYLSPNQQKNEEIILIHEREHCRGYHSIDLIIMAIYKSIFWFNPVIYSLNKMVKENHEFIADQKVLSKNISAWNYGRILLDENFRSTAPQLTSTFNTKSMLLKRIENLNLKNKYPMKNLLILPVLGALAMTSISMTTVVSPLSHGDQTSIKTNGPDTNPEYVGGNTALIAFITAEVKYPKKSSKAGNEGVVFVQFTVTKTGKITKATALKGSGFELLDKEAVRLVSSMPNWTPGTKDGLATNVQMTLPVSFKLD